MLFEDNIITSNKMIDYFRDHGVNLLTYNENLDWNKRYITI